MGPKGGARRDLTAVPADERGPLETLSLAGIGAVALVAQHADELASEIATRIGVERDEVRAVITDVVDSWRREAARLGETGGTMAAKAVLRDTGRVLGMPYGQVDRIAKLIPKVPLDLGLEDALGRSEKSRKETDRVVAEFRALYASDEDVKELVDLALKLEDLTRNAGKHAGGVVIAPGPLSDYAPLFSENGAEGMVTQFDKDDVEAVGLVKFDFLGLRTLTIIDWTVKAINKSRDSSLVIGDSKIPEPALANHQSPITNHRPLDIMSIPLDDPAVFDLLRKARTVAVFQF